MIQHLNLSGDLKFGKHKTISCAIQLEVDVHEDDDWGKPDPTYNPANYVDGVRVTGELSFDAGPIDSLDKHPVRPNALGELILRDVFPGDDSTKLNILVVEKTGCVDIIPKKVKRYFWLFFAVGKPIWDKLDIFPNNYRGVTMNRIFACTNFRGYWPVSVASVIVASDKAEAKQLLHRKLKEAKVNIENEDDWNLSEIDIQSKGAVILNDGAWQ